MNTNENNTVYEIIGEMARDVFGHVLRVRQTDSQTELTLHVLDSSLTKERGVIGMLQDATQTVKGLDHPNIASVLSFDPDFSHGAVVMRGMPGGSLAKAVAAGTTKDPTRAEAIIMQLAAGIAYLHRNQIVLHTLSPSAVFFDENNVARISPVVTGKLLTMASADDMQPMRAAVARSAYCAPELRLGGKGSFASDIYSLGLLFYDVLRGSTLELQPVQTLGVGEGWLQSIEPRWHPVLRKSVALTPLDRFQNMDELFEAIRTAAGQRQAQGFKPASMFGAEGGARPFFRPLAMGKAPGQVVRAPGGVEQPVIPVAVSGDMPRQPEPAIGQGDVPGQVAPSSTAEHGQPVKSDPDGIAPLDASSQTVQRKQEIARSHEYGSQQASLSQSYNLYTTQLEKQELEYKRPVQGTVSTDYPTYTSSRKEWQEIRRKRRTTIIVWSLITLLLLLAFSFILVRLLKEKVAPIPEQGESAEVETQAESEPLGKSDLTLPSVTATKAEQSQNAEGIKIREKDGMEMLYVPEGTFIMGSNDGFINERPVREVYLDAYWIDKYEVTNAQYAKCVDESACSPPKDSVLSTRLGYYGVQEYDNYPVIYIEWEQANIYCKWVGGSLPTEAQWEKAARGPDGNNYPWGNDSPTCYKANISGCGERNVGAVGSFPDDVSYYGAVDMAGNVSEWVQDWYGPYDENETNNPIGSVEENGQKVIRGASWSSNYVSSSSANRFYKYISDNTENVGFRCVYPSKVVDNTNDITVTQETTVEVQPAEQVLGIGLTMLREKDGMEMVYVPEGTFMMGSKDDDKNARDDEKPQRKIYLDAYWIDKYEITNVQYAMCVSSGSCTEPYKLGSATRISYYSSPEYNNYPVIYVDWDQANSYCNWVGGRLPTEAEWEKAARGPDGNEYPWGNEEPECSLANYDQRNEKQINYCVSDTTMAGSYPKGASYYGAMDMMGNVWEWVNDWYDLYLKDVLENPEGPKNGTERIMRGGSWSDDFINGRATQRLSRSPDVFLHNVGFRCVFPRE
jgi:formylglycine-generating enzyme required for sulfatase activity/serine/threonine protein kinase